MVRYREATEHDAGAIAALHADSWRRHYRGAYLDSYLDGDVVADRLEIWSCRLTPPRLNQYTVMAEDGGDAVGFAHAVFDDEIAIIESLQNGLFQQLVEAMIFPLLGQRLPPGGDRLQIASLGDPDATFRGGVSNYRV